MWHTALRKVPAEELRVLLLSKSSVSDQNSTAPFHPYPNKNRLIQGYQSPAVERLGSEVSEYKVPLW